MASKPWLLRRWSAGSPPFARSSARTALAWVALSVPSGLHREQRGEGAAVERSVRTVARPPPRWRRGERETAGVATGGTAAVTRSSRPWSHHRGDLVDGRVVVRSPRTASEPATAGSAGRGPSAAATSALPVGVRVDRDQVGLGEVAVVVGLLLGPHGAGPARPPRPSGGSPAPPCRRLETSSTWRVASYSMARTSDRSEFRFLISQRVPKLVGARAAAPRRWRRPGASPPPSARPRRPWRPGWPAARRRRHAPRSARRMSGALTISTSGTPARL